MRRPQPVTPVTCPGPHACSQAPLWHVEQTHLLAQLTGEVVIFPWTHYTISSPAPACWQMKTDTQAYQKPTTSPADFSILHTIRWSCQKLTDSAIKAAAKAINAWKYSRASCYP